MQVPKRARALAVIPASRRRGSRVGTVMLSVVLALGLVAIRPGATLGQATGVAKLNHIIVIYQENWGFDTLYGKFPGANGLANAGETLRQVDKNGQPYAVLPAPIDNSKNPPVPDPRFPTGMPVAPFDLTQFVKPEDRTGDLVHRFYQEQYQIDGGKMDRFIAWSDAAGLVMSYYDATNMPEGRLAQQFVLADNFFHAAFGGSFLNHFSWSAPARRRGRTPPTPSKRNWTPTAS